MLARAMPRQMFGEILSLIARLRADRFEICVAFTLREEGGYVDDPANPGGATNTGSPWRPTGNGPTTPISATSRSRR
jgi:hypothetical protein